MPRQDLPAEGVVVDVLQQLVTLCEHLADRRYAEGQHTRSAGRLGTFVTWVTRPPLRLSRSCCPVA